MLFKTTVFAVCALLFASLINAASVNPDADAQVLRYDADNIGTDGFKYGYETSNGISVQEEGQLQNAGSENEAISVRGQYQYTGPDNIVYQVSYVADENGFQPQGAHLPVAPQ
ncbi:flexible cuticle protein 12-like [Drosophila sulfurigaster albostrigata]|uniref:flexible cuticle protein 12-like n=1 Tax=Drosophila sulfurigaster albostrigata TaxID=89887 RepID=UPI002D21E270|nr:flexible cuticle protein 12-like [Drosophila sulfurigaster albostrigata]